MCLGRRAFLKKRFGLYAHSITRLAQHKLDRVAVGIYCSREVEPFSLDLDVCLVHTPGIVSLPEFGSAALLQNGGVMLNPAVYSSMIDTEAAFDHHLFQVTVAQGVAEIPANAQQDERCLKVAIFEELGLWLSWHAMGSDG